SPAQHRVGNCRLSDAGSGPCPKEEERHRECQAKEWIFHKLTLFHRVCVSTQTRRKRRCRVVVLVRAWAARSAAIKVRVFILFVTLFVRCRSHLVLLCLRWRERPNYRRNSDERATVTGIHGKSARFGQGK